MEDYIVRGMAANNQVRFFASYSKNLVEEARQRHETSPVATAALGRLLTAGAMMGSMCKNDTDLVTITVRGDGPIEGLTVTADAKANVKGYAYNPVVIIPPSWAGKLDVGAAIGYGTMTVIKDLGLKEPYSGQVNLCTSEIAEDLTYYFASSEQIPTSVALGVLMNKNNTVRQAGGFIIQLMPFASDELITALEQRLSNFSSITSHLDNGETPEQIIEALLEGYDVTYTDRIPTKFYCNCSKERVSNAVISVGKKEIQKMIDDGEEIEVNCHFCNSHYKFSVEELKNLYESAK